MATEKTGVVYRIWNRVTGKSYVGQTLNPRVRIARHMDKKGGSPALCNAIKKHGKDAFVIEILEEDVPAELLSKLEILHIRFFNCKTPDGYNLTGGGESTSGENNPFYGKSHSPESIKRMSESHKNMSPDTRRKISEANKGKPSPRKGVKLSPEARRQMSERQKGKRKGQENHFYGKKHTVESKQQMSESLKGRVPWNKGKTGVYSEETRRQISETLKGENNPQWGKSKSPETRRRISAAQKGREGRKGAENSFYGKKHSEESRRKMSESQKKAHARKRAERANPQLTLFD